MYIYIYIHIYIYMYIYIYIHIYICIYTYTQKTHTPNTNQPIFFRWFFGRVKPTNHHMNLRVYEQFLVVANFDVKSALPKSLLSLKKADPFPLEVQRLLKERFKHHFFKQGRLIIQNWGLSYYSNSI